MRRPALFVAHLAQPHQVVAQRLVVLVPRVVLDDGDDRVLLDEAGEVVDVAVGVVADDAVAEPEDVADAEVVAQILLDLRRG